MITVTQTCDGCLEVREMPAEAKRSGYSVEDIARGLPAWQDRDGWREVRKNRHLCPECIQIAMGESNGTQ